MTTFQKRKQLSEFLKEKADERFINLVYAMMQEYAPELKPMTEEEFLARNTKSQNDIKLGKLVNQKEVKKHFTPRISLVEPGKKTTK